MRNKKKDEAEKTPEQLALEEKVDALMDPKKPDQVPARNVPPPAPEKPVIKASYPVSETKTAPQLSTKLRKQISVNDVPTAPLSIDKLDELTKSIAGPETDDKPDAGSKSPSKAPGPEAGPEPPEPAGTVPQADAIGETTDLDDAQTDEAVDSIVAYESDVMLAVADSTAEERNRSAAAASGGKSTSRHPFSTFLWTLIFVLAILAIIAFVLLVSGGNLPGLRST